MSAWTQYIDNNKQSLIDRLGQAVAIPSVSGDASYRKEVFRMADWLKKEWENVGAKIDKLDLGKQTLPDGTVLDLPPALIGRLGEDPNKKTILIYGHYDVQPAFKEDGWSTEPFEMYVDQEHNVLRGRGSTDDKGPIIGWLNVVEAHVKSNTELPVNLRMCFEGMEESGSEGLDAAVYDQAKKSWTDVDAVCISDNYWLGTEKPCLTYGLRGVCYYGINIKGPGADLHSGTFGGIVNEPMTDLIQLMSKLVTVDGKILIPGVNELVKPLTDDEKKLYDVMDFSIQDAESAIGAQVVKHNDKSSMLMSRMRYPTLSLHGIEGAFSTPGSKTVIPSKVIGKFSLRIVPDQTPQAIDKLVEDYLQQEFAKLGTKNKLVVESMHGGAPWLADTNHWNYRAAFKATVDVYGQEPDMTREGGSIPVTLTFQEALNKNVLLLPMGQGNDGAHSINEKLSITNYIEGTKLLGTYLHEVSRTN